MKLTTHFWSDEFLVSEKRQDLLDDVVFSDDQIQRLYLLCSFGLQRIRDAYGPIKILSGYRTPSLNKIVRGSLSSQHMNCEAADFCMTKHIPLETVFSYIRYQLLWPGQAFFYRGKRFIHLALPRLGVTSVLQTREE
jgi:zinc D-Ala-D-Ala carboxypeptidase